jgi:pimeloyl-ACP methyl ester carboxylesterase
MTTTAKATATLVLLLLAASTACRHRSAGPGPDDVPPSGPIVVPTDDGAEIHGDYYGPGAAAVRAPAVLLLHMYSHDRRSWTPLVPSLHAAGYAVLAIDLRGHGESTHKGAGTLRYDTMMKDPAGNQFLEMYRDVAAARAWLASRSELDPARFGLVAASVGTSVALDVLARDPSVKGAVLMTPGVSYFGFPSLEHARKVVQPLLMVAATEERAGAEAVAAAHPDGAAERKVVLKEGVGHGTKMFPVWPEVKPLILDWVKTHI